SNIQASRGVTQRMRIAVDVFALAGEPSVQVQYDHVLGMMLRPGFIEVGLQRSAMRRVTFQTGEMGFFPRYMERWVGSGHQERLLLLISDAALRAAREAISHTGELDHWCQMGDVRLAALVKAVNAERIAGFPSGRLFLDSVEQAIAAALVDAFAGQSRFVRPLRGGLGPARLRTVRELVQAKMEDDLTLIEMAQAVDLSPAHFSRMFHKSTGETPHQFVLRNRIERAKEMLREAEARVLDVAVACGFKTQQHFARVFRRICGTSPTEYRYEVVRQ
ncbi:MAG TPA: helix-turn-helix domain-containing protein, partial [Terriglobales bacterium]